MNFIQDIINNSHLPILTAFLLGIIIVLHPCLFATNIAAMAYMAKDAHDRRKLFHNCLLYTFGRVLAYSLLGILLISVLRGGAQMMNLTTWFTAWGERLLAPFLIIAGLYFLLNQLVRRHTHCHNVDTKRKVNSYAGCLLLGIVLALSFCPESAIVYFCMLLPMSAKSTVGYFLPVVFAIATAIPTVMLAWGVAYGLSNSSLMRERMDKFQKWMNVIVGIIFVIAGALCLFF
ncbi:MAG: aromatic aminobenezylarsenical efflux permease ArsG family transporter [Prevotella sp.]|nr:aromatic aminobenezylarsenical efflux permease ArsG family transporter [Prevotella sp.]